MKIILVHCHYQQPGGEDVVFQQERQLLERAGHEVVVFIRSNEGLDSYSKVQRLVLIQKAIWNTGMQKEFSEVLRTEKPDVVHVHNTWVAISPSIYKACQDANVPVVQTHHNYRLMCPCGTFFRNGAACEECIDHSLLRSVRYGCYRDSRSTTAAKALMLAVHRGLHTWDRDINCHIVLTEFAKSKFLRGGLPPERMFVKPNFVHPDPLPATNSHGAGGGNGKYALFAGRLAPKKRVTTVLSAWSRLRSRIPLVIVGGGIEQEELEQEAAQDRLSAITFRGTLPHDETLAVMSGARFLIFSSEWYETFGLTMVEAFACGVPVICSRVGAMREIVDDGRTGLHFNAGDADDLAAKVEWALSHPERLQEMGREARQEYESKYTAEKNYPRLMEIYQHAIARRN
ncbi:MAG: glycosyltransferase family 4 protein [Candidatus Sulfotelmatobacter sp.]